MDSAERTDLVRRLFALMTIKLEDAVSEAADGQRADQSGTQQIAHADAVELFARDVGLLAESAAAIARGDRSA